MAINEPIITFYLNTAQERNATKLDSIRLAEGTFLLGKYVSLTLQRD